jgi:hypothetical protein
MAKNSKDEIAVQWSDIEKTLAAQWSDIEKTLPGTADRTEFRNRLAHIAHANTSPEQEAVQWQEYARYYDKLARIPGNQVAEQLRQIGNDAKKLAARYRQVGKIDRPRYVLYWELLYLWETIGGDLKITTPCRTKIWLASHDTTKWPPPRGPVIAYFQAVRKAIFGRALSGWQIKEIVQEYKRLHFSAAMTAALNSSQLCAAIGIPFKPGQQVRLSIDESKIFIAHEGKLIDKDGNVVGNV